MLAAILALWGWCSLRGVYAYRQLTKILEQRADELPIASQLQQAVQDLRVGYELSRDNIRDPFGLGHDNFFSQSIARQDGGTFHSQLDEVQRHVKSYAMQLRGEIENGPLLSNRSNELQIIKQIFSKLDHVRDATAKSNWELDRACVLMVKQDIEELAASVNDLPKFFQVRIAGFRDEVRSQYRTWLVLIWLGSIAAMVIVLVAFWFLRWSIFQRFRTLLQGSRTIARGEFEHRIRLSGNDEISELADVLNSMTARFIEIRDHLNEKVQQRTREVVRSEQLASVGFLAAGVAHEINNPLASIAWSAEALESRLHEILHGSPGSLEPTATDDLEVLRKYLKRIQDEAFRCKGITEKLLDFSRLNDSQPRQPTDVKELIDDVIALVQPLSQYRHKHIEFAGHAQCMACVSPQEFKQVVLNLLTNALDSMNDGGVVSVRLAADGDALRLILQDDGCGMSAEVQRHLFEPFFTRRRDGKGTGLGLSISYRIVQDHGGTIVPYSAGPGKGSRFEVLLPLDGDEVHTHEFKHKAA